MSAVKKPTVSPDRVLAKAVLRAAEQLGLSQSQLADVLGMHRTGISRMKTKQSLAPDSKQGELALLLVRIARSLFALTGGDQAWSRHFMVSPNQLTGGVPVEQLKSIQGLVTVMQCVDALRGKV